VDREDREVADDQGYAHYADDVTHRSIARRRWRRNTDYIAAQLMPAASYLLPQQRRHLVFGCTPRRTVP